MPDAVEIWFTPTGGMSGGPLLLESRVLADGEPLPVTYEFGGTLLIASATAERHEAADGRGLWRVHVFDPDYCVPGDVEPKPAPAKHHPPADDSS